MVKDVLIQTSTLTNYGKYIETIKAQNITKSKKSKKNHKHYFSETGEIKTVETLKFSDTFMTRSVSFSDFYPSFIVSRPINIEQVLSRRIIQYDMKISFFDTVLRTIEKTHKKMMKRRQTNLLWSLKWNKIKMCEYIENPWYYYDQNKTKLKPEFYNVCKKTINSINNNYKDMNHNQRINK